jgi:hypothetical protein
VLQASQISVESSPVRACAKSIRLPKTTSACFSPSTTVLEGRAALLAHGLGASEPAPKALFSNGQLSEGQKIFVGRPFSSAVKKSSERGNDACLHRFPGTPRGSPVAALAFLPCAGFVYRPSRVS